MKQWKASQWQSATGRWYVNCTDNLVSPAGLWWFPSRILGISPAQLISLLHNKYHASHFHYDAQHDVLIYSWDNETDAHRWLLDINREARNRKVMI